MPPGADGTRARSHRDPRGPRRASRGSFASGSAAPSLPPLRGIPLSDLASRVDATLLVPWASPSEIERLAQDAARYRAAAVCILPPHVRRAAGLLAGAGVGIAAAISFPAGGAPPIAKALEAETAVRDGATELDIVMNLGSICAGEWTVIRAEVEAVERAAGSCLTKWIVEESALSDEELRLAVDCVADGGGDFLKNGTGHGPKGASVAAVLRLKALARGLGIKASGGIRTASFARELIAAGAGRIGTSAWRALLDPAAGERRT